MAQNGKFNSEIPRFSGDQNERQKQLEDYLYHLEENLRIAFTRIERRLDKLEEKEE